MNGKCELCERDFRELNFHHLIPKTLHNNKLFKKKFTKEFMVTHGIWICKRDCHKEIHKFIEEKDLGLIYNTKEKLLEHPEVRKYIEWIRKR